MRSVLNLNNVTKRYSTTVALDDVTVELRQNEVLGLIGQNGSGKSSLLKIMSGLIQPDSGEVLVSGGRGHLTSSAEASRLGIGLVHQEQSLIGSLTVAENLFLGRASNFVRAGFYRWAAMSATARHYLARVDLDISPDSLVDSLTFAQRQMVELAKVLTLEEMTDGDLVVLFDEPTSVLTRLEVDILFNQIRKIKERASVVFISHRMDEVLEISDRIYVLSDGKIVADMMAVDTHADELYELMVGRQRLSSTLPRRRSPIHDGPRRLEVTGLSVKNRLRGVNLSLAPGEIIGMIGVQDSGAEALCRAVFGVEEQVQGEILVDGKVVAIKGPRDAVRLGIGYLPAERKTEGMLRGISVAENITATFGASLGPGLGILSQRRELREAQSWIKRLAIKVPDPNVRIDTLSGGNQQKAVLSKWLMAPKLRLLLLDHPTRGLDPGARSDLFNVIKGMADEGLAVLFVGDTLDEVLMYSDTLIAMKDGAISHRFENVQSDPPSEESVVRAIV
jgi:ribose transport system ATP-binding protein